MGEVFRLHVVAYNLICLASLLREGVVGMTVAERAATYSFATETRQTLNPLLA